MSPRVANAALLIVHSMLFYAVLEIVTRNLEPTWYRWTLSTLGFFLIIYGSVFVRRKYGFLFKPLSPDDNKIKAHSENSRKTKIISKDDWFSAGVASIIIAALFNAYKGDKHSFFFTWSAAFIGLLMGFFLFAGVKRFIIKIL